MASSDFGDGIDLDAAFRLCVQISSFSAKLDDGSCVDVLRKCDEWVVDYRCYTMEKLEIDLAARVKWGKFQQPAFSEFDMITSEERKLVDDASLLLAFSRRMSEKKLFLYVDIEDKQAELNCNALTENAALTEGAMSNALTENGSSVLDWNSCEIGQDNHVDDGGVIDWNSLEIEPIPEVYMGGAVPILDEDAVFAFVGLRAEDEKAEKVRTAAAENEDRYDIIADPLDLEGAELPVHDTIPGEDSAFYDMEDPPMEVGTRYASMGEFRAALRIHAINRQFQLGTEKSCKERFRGYCAAEGCPWSIVARLMDDGKQVRVHLS